MRSQLLSTGSGSRASFLESLESVETQRAVLSTQRSQRDVAVASLDVLSQERSKTIRSFVADNCQKLAEAEKRVDDLEQRLKKTELRLERTRLKSPIDGTALALAVTTVGQVLSSGQEALRVVPDGASLEIEGYLSNDDIGFVRVGQTAVVKVASFPFTRYGTLAAEVTGIAHDAIPEPDAAAAGANAAASLKAGSAAAPPTRNLVFPVTLSLKRTAMSIDGQMVPLGPGMEVSVEIATGSRRILDYFLSPIAEVASQALKDR
jgi:hemolysin D